MEGVSRVTLQVRPSCRNEAVRSLGENPTAYLTLRHGVVTVMVVGLGEYSLADADKRWTTASKEVVTTPSGKKQVRYLSVFDEAAKLAGVALMPTRVRKDQQYLRSIWN